MVQRMRRNARRRNTKLTLKKVDKKVKRIQRNVELKYFDLGQEQAITQLGVGFLLNPIVVGDTARTRTGDEVQNTSLQIRGRFYTDSLNLAPSLVRMVVYWDRQANGTDSVLAASPVDPLSVLDNTTPLAATVEALFSPIMYPNLHRYTVLFDKTYTLTPQQWLVASNGAPSTVTANEQIFRAFSKRIRLGRNTKYLSAAGADNSISSNALWVAFMCDAAANPPTVEFCSRIYFKDA